MTLTDCEIELVVGWCNFQNSASERWIDCFVAYDRDLRARKRSPAMFADEELVSGIVGVDRNAGITHQCFRTRSRDFQEGARILDHLVAHVIKFSIRRSRDHL